jgi:hypothetical protein
MKTKTTPPKKSVETIQAGESFKSAPSLSEITNSFIQKQTQKNKDNGANSVIADFATLSRMVIANMSSFAVQDILAMSRPLDTQCSALVPMILLWVEELKKHNRIKIQMSCYDAQQFFFQ